MIGIRSSCLKPNHILDLNADARVANRLKEGLRAGGALATVGLDPEAFAIDRKLRPTPFPGLAPFGDDDADAAIFYGRSREIAEVLEALRQMRAAADRRPLIILGASGSGKSSLLKAGIIPRLRREARTWLPLRAFRPGADPLLHFAEALARTMADFGKDEAYGPIRDRLFNAWSRATCAVGSVASASADALKEALEAEGRRLRAAAGCPEATILVSLDQAEELTRLEGDSCEALAEYLRVTLTTATSWQLALTIRTDSFPDLQNSPYFKSLEARGYDLRAIPAFRFESVVQEPARRYGVNVDSALVDTLIRDAPEDDALPLLAFALQRLWGQYQTTGTLNLEQYRKIGGLDGLIEDAAERALRGLSPQEDVPLPAIPPTKRLEELGASTFVPALAQINEKGVISRRIAAWNSFNEEQKDLLDRFIHWYLVVVRKVEADNVTVEVTAEALFRKWNRLNRWLEPERARLEAMRLLQLGSKLINFSTATIRS